MTNELTSTQFEKILVAKKYFNNSNDPDSLYQVVVILGPSFLGSFIGSNSETVWSRIENPENFRYEEMRILSEVFEIPIEQFLDKIKKQIQHNLEELELGRPVGRKRYNNKEDKNKPEISITRNKARKE